MIALIDYDAGNMKSVEKALQLHGPGDGGYPRSRSRSCGADRSDPAGSGKLRGRHGESAPVRAGGGDPPRWTAQGTPFLGICLGLQLLFESSQESPGVEGLGLLPGEILRIPAGEGS